MIIDKITYTKEEQLEIQELNRQFMDAVKEIREILPNTNDSELSFMHFLKQDGAEEVLNKLATADTLLKQNRREAEVRHMKELGTSDAILAEANEIIQALEKEDFQEFVRTARSKLKAGQSEEMKRDKEFQASIKHFSYTFESAYRFIITQVTAYCIALKDLGEETEIIDNGEPITIKYLDLLEIEALRKARNDFGYTPKTERKKRGQKQTTSLAEELTAVESIESKDLYSKIISDKVTGSIETSIGKKPRQDPISQYRIIENKYGQLEWINDEDSEFLSEIDRKAIPTESVLLLNMLLQKLTPQIPTLKLFKGKLKPTEQAELDKIRDTLKDEKVRTVTLTLGEYMDKRQSKGRKATAKETIEYALRSIGSLETKIDGKGYYMFSSKPQDMYKAGKIEAVINYDWCTHLYTDGSKLVFFPESLYTVDLRKHPHAVILYNWLRQNYEANTYKQNPHTNRVKIITTIENVPVLKDIYEQETTPVVDSNGHKKTQGRIWDRVIDPLLKNLESLKKVYGVLDYEILDKNLNKISGSKFNKMPTSAKLECWIRYEFTDYPNWKAPEQLTAKGKQKDHKEDSTE